MLAKFGQWICPAPGRRSYPSVQFSQRPRPVLIRAALPALQELHSPQSELSAEAETWSRIAPEVSQSGRESGVLSNRAVDFAQLKILHVHRSLAQLVQLDIERVYCSSGDY